MEQGKEGLRGKGKGGTERRKEETGFREDSVFWGSH